MALSTGRATPPGAWAAIPRLASPPNTSRRLHNIGSHSTTFHSIAWFYFVGAGQSRVESFRVDTSLVDE